ncbi:heterokaryon incompatibility protein-domain-containing protein [Boeremia exigua]|uniref:heterokaryon incompatibility protein-domain-containing protein n=1 Tax=Boeremia exigua TaxID=749465 RepID=UPI001E8E3C02|nr:heterokaryon incompatibility protein-domain-containing protein [Boeremia exigua]KAH6644333.1 heterokaryon incompatibility protein-domain-containing protein [Boeremia exigua]
MWLINVETRKLECFNDERDLPLYAILSHTWTNTEITMQMYRDLPEDRSRQYGYIQISRGYDKIDRSCQQARADGLPYLWVDTCCIDKTSSAELSEAINSMFRWYQGAVICYVYLDDLAKARWFTRGWTLQELIAPKDVIFYDQRWTRIGTKRSLKFDISRITRIHELVLGGKVRLRSVDVAQRMTWAAGRATSKVEDKAYSLFGIFGVHMPLLYGEGTKAFTRLQEEILKESDDMSLPGRRGGVEERGAGAAACVGSGARGVDSCGGSATVLQGFGAE